MPRELISHPIRHFNKLAAHHFGMVAAGTGVMCLIFWAWCLIINSNPDNKWVIFLYSLPLVVQVFGLFMLGGKLIHWSNNPDAGRMSRKGRLAFEKFALFYFYVTLVCSSGYSFLSVFYISREARYNWTNDDISQWANYSHYTHLKTLSYIALVLIFVLLICAVVMTRAVVSGRLIRDRPDGGGGQGTEANINGGGEDTATEARGPENRYLDNLKTGAAQEPFLVLLFFFTVFLGIAHLFGLALAFHDKNEFIRSGGKNPALYMRSIRKPETPASPATPTQTPATAATSPAPESAATAGSTPAPTPPPFRFEFNSASALLNIEDPPQVSSEKQREYEQHKRRDKGGMYATINDIADKIISVTSGQARARVEIVGHSDQKDIQGPAYKSNQELAAARAENVKYKIMKELSFRDEKQWREIEWVCVSESNEGSNDRKVDVFVREVAHDPVPSQMPHLESQLLPLVNEEKPHPLNLMDYIYFANYTITTTGYGDIIPNTAYTKFICSFANICEVFFLVVLFNTLLSLKQDKNEEEAQRARELSIRKEMALLEEIEQSVKTNTELKKESDAASRPNFFQWLGQLFGLRPKQTPKS
jgi:outer membrane protein OmpA-like peptidoglycan-associated protein